ncbi:MAG: hypothetical protein PHT02_01460 [Tissierellia bacterium]|nr:hypothetical protein [Tissierellia bacterium]
MNNKNYKIANLKDKDCSCFKDIEEKLKMETGKDIVLVAWECDK